MFVDPLVDSTRFRRSVLASARVMRRVDCYPSTDEKRSLDNFSTRRDDGASSMRTTALTAVALAGDTMLDKLGMAGLLGVLVMLAGIVIVAWQNLFLAAGLAFVVAGLGLIVYGMVSNLLSAFGFGGGGMGGMGGGLQ